MSTREPSAWDLLPGMLLELAPDGQALVANRAFAQFTGRPVASALGAAWLELLTAECRPVMLDALAQRSDFTLALWLTRADGSFAHVDAAARWLAERSLYLCMLHDVSVRRSDELAARAQAEQMRLLANNVPAMIAYYDADTLQCRFANAQYARAFGCDEQSVVGRTVTDVIGDEAAHEIQPQVDRVLRDKLPAMYERQLRARDGTPRWLEVHLLPHIDEGGNAVGSFVLISDITKHRLAEAAVRESEERLAKFMQASVEGIVFHKDGTITDANPPLLALIGCTLAEVRGRNVLSFIAPEHVARVLAVMSRGEETSYELAILHKDGSRIPVEFIVRTMERNGERIRMTIVRDIRDRQAAQARIHHLAHHDALTGLPNRGTFMEQIDHLIAGARLTQSQLALLFIDLDHFKRVNDSLGHLVGDTLLQTVAGRITASLRTTDLVARFGGDEFMILLPGAVQRADVEEVASKLLQSIEVPAEVEGQSISVTPSIGIAMFPHDGATPAELIKHADSAMYRAKSRGRANYQFFDPSIARTAYAALVLESQLAIGLERGEFVLHYQPQVRARDGELVGVEALIRWQHPERGLLLPAEFIAVAEQRRLMVGIGHGTLREAVRCARRWHARRAGRPPVPVAVNLSSVEFRAAGFVNRVAQVLREEGVAGELLEIELTERMLMDDVLEVKQMLAQLKALGTRIAVDDFGTGYSSLGHLKDLPIDKIKIDRSFVQDLPADHGSAAIARATIQLARSLGITVIAEGVETDAQRSFLLEHGCDELQGDLISPPLPALAIDDWVGEPKVSAA
jgi:diguanylate cyclase (GGDEF)-like protein/PAS domain S-box-containing protein